MYAVGFVKGKLISIHVYVGTNGVLAFKFWSCGELDFKESIGSVILEKF